MKDRIRKFIEFKKITAADLADKLEVQRSNVSHVLNGRNKPGANFIEKLLTEYPELNARWLLTGDGEMLSSKKEQLRNLFENDITGILKPESAPVLNELKHHMKGEIQSQNTDNELKISKNNKAVERIVVFYTDKTFSEYQPE